MSEELVLQHQQGILAGVHSFNIALGLESPPAHVERAEREILDRALPELAALVGPAARLIDCGPFTGLRTAHILGALERPKANVLLNRDIDPRIFDVLQSKAPTAEISVAPASATPSHWDLPAIGSGTSLAMIAAGGFGFMTAAERAALIAGAWTTLKTDDFLLITIELPQDAALAEATYQEFGQHLVRTCLTRLGKSHGLEPRVFHQAIHQHIQFGALAQKDATLQWQDAGCGFNPGEWLSMGAVQHFTAESLAEEVADFCLQKTWRASDGRVEVMVFQKK